MKREKDLWAGRIRCPDCHGWMEKRRLRMEGIPVRAWRCPLCREEALHPQDAEKALFLQRVRREGVSVKVGELRQGPYVRFPKEMRAVVRKGDTALIQAKSPTEFLIKITSKT